MRPNEYTHQSNELVLSPIKLETLFHPRDITSYSTLAFNVFHEDWTATEIPWVFSRNEFNESACGYIFYSFQFFSSIPFGFECVKSARSALIGFRLLSGRGDTLKLTVKVINNMCDGYRSSKLRCSFELIFRGALVGADTATPTTTNVWQTLASRTDRQTDSQSTDKYMHAFYAHSIIIIITNFAHLLKTSM